MPSSFVRPSRTVPALVQALRAWVRRRLCAGAALALLALGPALAQAADAPGASAAAKPSDAAALYHNYCSVCHGDKGDGQSRARGSLNPPPRDFTSAQSLQELTRERMIAAVGGGVPGTAMVGWSSQLSAQQIERIVDYVRDTFMRASATADASRGRRIYARSCSVCHGDRGSGSMWASANLRPAPRDFSAPQARTELTRERMVASVAAGRPGTAMTGFASQLSREDIDAVVDYVRSAFMGVGADAGISGTKAHAVPQGSGGAGAGSPHGAPAGLQLGSATTAATLGAAAAAAPAAIKADMSLPLPHGLKADLKAGKRFYDSNCATCHGVKGDGKGPRAYFINPKPRNFIVSPWREQLNRPAIFAAVSAGRLGTEMPAWDKVLTRQEIANVSEYVYTAFIRGNAAR